MPGGDHPKTVKNLLERIRSAEPILVEPAGAPVYDGPFRPDADTLLGASPLMQDPILRSTIACIETARSTIELMDHAIREMRRTSLIANALAFVLGGLTMAIVAFRFPGWFQ